MWARIRDTPVELPSTDRPPRVLQPLRDFVPWRYRSPTVNAHPTDSINHALVVIPTNSDKATLSRTQRSSGNEYWSGGPGVAGSSPVSPIRSPLQCSEAVFTQLQPLPTCGDQPLCRD